MAPINRQGFAAGQQITKLLDALGNLHSGRLGVPWWFVRVHLVTGGAWAMAAMQAMSFPYIITDLFEELPMNYTESVFLVVGVMILGSVVGVFFFGYLAEARGHKFATLIAFALTPRVRSARWVPVPKCSQSSGSSSESN